MLTFTATRWGSLLDRKLVPPALAVPRASDCYRFVLSHPSVHTTLAGPRDGVELDEAMVLAEGLVSAIVQSVLKNKPRELETLKRK